MLAAVCRSSRAVIGRQLAPALCHYEASCSYSTPSAAAGGGHVVELQSDAEYQSAVKQLAATKSSAVFDFTAKWCGPCKMIAPIYEALAAEYPGVRFFKLDIDNAALAGAVGENGVSAVPTFVGYQGADRVTAFSGADKAMLRRLANELSGQHLKPPPGGA